MQTVCLITPPSPFLLDQRVFMSLGILKVASSLERVGRQVHHLDLSGVNDFLGVVRQYLKDNPHTRFFGITATTPQMPMALQICKIIKDEQAWLLRIVLGGPHVTLVNASAKTGNERSCKQLRALRREFDVLVAGDGEDACLHAFSPTAKPDWLIDADDPKGTLFLTSKRLEETPLPARHLVDVNSYRYSIDGTKALSMICQLGCPFACAFCGGRLSPMLRRIRTRSTENVVGELRHLHELYGVRAAMFYDDELNVNKQVVGLMNAIAALGKELGFEWKLRGFVKAELLTDEQAEAMYRAGFRWLLVGFESGSPRILENINKKATREDNTRALQICKRHGIKVKALMSLGHAGESAETICQTKEWLLEQKPDDFDATVITVYPGTPYHDEAVETSPGVWTYTARSGDRLHAYDSDWATDGGYYKGKLGEYKSLVFTDHLTAAQIVSLRDDLEADVRRELGIPYNAGAPGVLFEASMGQLPGFVLRRTAEAVTA